MSGRKMHKEAHTIGLIHLRKVLEHFMSNECLYRVAYHPIFYTERVLKTWLLLFCVQFESQQCGGTWYGETHNWLTDTANSSINLPSISKAGLKQFISMLWMSLLTVQHPIFRTERIPKTCILLVIWEPTFVEHYRSEIHTCLSDAQGSSFHLLNASKKGFEERHKQWMSLLAGQYPIFCTERVSKTWHFACNLRANLGRKWLSGTNNW